MKILIAEDDPVSRKILEGNLRKKGFDVVVTKDGREAWEAIRQPDPPPLAILDWMMPGMDGLTVTQRIRQDFQEFYTYIIILTAKGSKEDIRTALDAGADDYIVKPFSPIELNARIQVGIRIINLHKKLNEHIEKLKFYDRQKTDFLATASHELRTPLAIIGEGVSLFMDGVAGELNDVQKDLMGDIQDNVEGLKRLISDLLDISKIESGKIVLHKSTVDFGQIADYLEKGIGFQAIKKGIQFNVEKPDTPIRIFADGDKIKQIFSNLISNAIRYTEKGGEITVRIEETGTHVQCSVSDTGKGISKKDQPLLFSQFAQLGRAHNEEYKGTGLGLVIVKGLVERHRGAISVESDIGQGATFAFTIAKEDFPTILLVDDEQPVIDVARELLVDNNYHFLEASTGKEAIRIARQEMPDLILLDLKLPDVSGYEVIGRLKQDARTRDIPILVMSAYEIDEDRLQKLNENAAIPYVGKPFNPKRLHETILDQWIER